MKKTVLTIQKREFCSDPPVLALRNDCFGQSWPGSQWNEATINGERH